LYGQREELGKGVLARKRVRSPGDGAKAHVERFDGFGVGENVPGLPEGSPNRWDHLHPVFAFAQLLEAGVRVHLFLTPENRCSSASAIVDV